MQHISSQLHPGARSGFTSMDDQGCPSREGFLHMGERGVVRTDHHRQLALLRRAIAAADRCVDDMNIRGPEPVGKLDCSIWTDSRMDRNDRAWLRGSRNFADDLAHLSVVEHNNMNEVGLSDI